MNLDMDIADDPFSVENVKLFFDRPVTAENIFILITNLNSCNNSTLNSIFKSFIISLSTNKNSTNSPSIMASWGIYLSIILRYNPDTNLYINNRHYLIVAFESYKPYINLYITFFLAISVLKRVNIKSPYKENNAMTVMDKLIESCSNGSNERKLLSNVKRFSSSSSDIFIHRSGLKESKSELGIFLD